jgi:hypothetical protein
MRKLTLFVFSCSEQAMPKLNSIKLVARIEKRIADLENGDAFEARDINALLTKEQQMELKILWGQQQELRKKHKPPKTAEAMRAIGWKTIRDVRIEVYKKALAEAEGSVLDDLKLQMARKEVRKAKVYLDAYFDAKQNNKNAESAGNIAVRRAGFQPTRKKQSVGSQLTKRDQLVRTMETDLRKMLDKRDDES